MEKLTEDWLSWLHELTIKLYDHKIILSATRLNEIKAMFEHGKTVQQAYEILVSAS